MTVENISWSISTKECCLPRWGLNPRPPGLQSDGASNWATEAGIVFRYTNVHLMGQLRLVQTLRKKPIVIFLPEIEAGPPAWQTDKTASITKTYLYNFDPLKPHFYIVKLGFTGVYIIFLISAQSIDCGYSLEPPRWGGSNEYPQSMFCGEIWKISEFFYLKIFCFLEIKFSIYLNRRVFVML